MQHTIEVLIDNGISVHALNHHTWIVVSQGRKLWSEGRFYAQNLWLMAGGDKETSLLGWKLKRLRDTIR